MKKIIKTQDELDQLKQIEKGDEVIIEASLRLNCILDVFGVLRVNAALDCNRWQGRYVRAKGNSSVVARENSSVVARENSSVVARGNSSVEAWENSSVVARENSSVVARENSSVVAWGNSSVEARGNSSVEARENSSVVAWGNSSVVARENSSVRVISASIQLSLHGFSMLSLPFDLKLKFEKEKTCLVQKFKPQPYLEREGIPVNKGKVVLFKKVSHDFKTQEGTPNETLWAIGTTVTHPAWSPKKEECGEGKFHACSRPYFCDEFRNNAGDIYISIEIATKDLYEWPNASYPHKIAFRKGQVLYQCDRLERKI